VAPTSARGGLHATARSRPVAAGWHSNFAGSRRSAGTADRDELPLAVDRDEPLGSSLPGLVRLPHPISPGPPPAGRPALPGIAGLWTSSPPPGATGRRRTPLPMPSSISATSSTGGTTRPTTRVGLRTRPSASAAPWRTSARSPTPSTRPWPPWRRLGNVSRRRKTAIREGGPPRARGAKPARTTPRPRRPVLSARARALPPPPFRGFTSWETTV